jgi:hypothetical protein
MTLEDFRRLAETWGGDLGRWPAAERDAARALAATPQGRAILERARQLDALMAAPPDVPPERVRGAVHAVVLQVAADAERTSRSRWSWDLPGWFVPAMSVACSALIGISLGMALPSGDAPEPMVLGMILDSGSIAADWSLQ